MTSPHVFISHTEEDQRYAEELSLALHDMGIDATLPASFQAGGSIDEQLQKALGSATLYVALVSERTLMSPWVLFELGAALGRHTPLLLVYLSDEAARSAPAALRRSIAIQAKSLRPAEVANEVAVLAAKLPEGRDTQ